MRSKWRMFPAGSLFVTNKRGDRCPGPDEMQCSSAQHGEKFSCTLGKKKKKKKKNNLGIYLFYLFFFFNLFF